MDFVRETESGVFLDIRVSPRSSRSGVTEVSEGRLKVRLNSPPVDGAANKEIVRLFSKLTGKAKSLVNIDSGEKSRNKTLHISDITKAELLACLSISE
ncbi:MAG: DUF167 domain-containing protein [Pyrinomonadaceae bacterium]